MKIYNYLNKESKFAQYSYLFLRILVIIIMIHHIFMKDWESVFYCLLTLVLFLVPFIIEHRFKIIIPDLLEVIILLFIFSAEILGTIQNFYGLFPYWDTMLHTINGFLCAAIGFSIIDILNQSHKIRLQLSAAFVALVAFCFSMTIGVLWEFYEFSADYFFQKDLQNDRVVKEFGSLYFKNNVALNNTVIKDISKTIIHYQENGEEKEVIIENGYLDIGIIDTMKDLFVNFIGAIIFCMIGYAYIRHREKYQFLENFIPTVNQQDT